MVSRAEMGTLLTSSACIGINMVAVAEFDVTSVIHAISKVGF